MVIVTSASGQASRAAFSAAAASSVLPCARRLAASPVSAVVGEGLPDYVAKDIPPPGPLKIDRPEVYFGDAQPDYALAPSAQREFNYPQGDTNAQTTYRGTHGVRVDGTAEVKVTFAGRVIPAARSQSQ